jgi:hypothetical protein
MGRVGVLGQGAKRQGCYDGHDGGGESAIHIGFLGLIGEGTPTG